MDRKEFLYIPSLSAGSMVSSFKKNTKFEDGTSMRFFSKEYPEKWRHPYFLVTAGHHYKKMDFRDQLGLDDGTFVFGDATHVPRVGIVNNFTNLSNTEVVFRISAKTLLVESKTATITIIGNETGGATTINLTVNKASTATISNATS